MNLIRSNDWKNRWGNIQACKLTWWTALDRSYFIIFFDHEKSTLWIEFLKHRWYSRERKRNSCFFLSYIMRLSECFLSVFCVFSPVLFVNVSNIHLNYNVNILKSSSNTFFFFTIKIRYENGIKIINLFYPYNLLMSHLSILIVFFERRIQRYFHFEFYKISRFFSFFIYLFIFLCFMRHNRTIWKRYHWFFRKWPFVTSKIAMLYQYDNS